MADKRISQLVDRGTVANNDVVPIVVSGATTTNKATISSIQTFMQGNLDLGVTSVGITLGSSGTDVSVSGSPITSSGNITINLPTASATNRGLLSAADWVTFNSKQDAGSFVTLDTTQTITSQKTFTTSGSSDTMIISHGSGSGFALDVLKAGNGEAIRVTKTSGSGNAMTISGGNFEAGTIVKTGGTSSQFLKADGSVDSSTYLTTGSAASTYVPYSGATGNVDLGTQGLTAGALFVEAGPTYGGALNLRQASGHSLWSGAPYTSIYAQPGNRVVFNFSNDNRTVTLDGSLVSASTPRTFTFPDATGTLALTTDIPSLAGYVTLATTQTITGAKTFDTTTSDFLILNSTNASGGALTFRRNGTNLGHIGNSGVLGVGILDDLEVRSGISRALHLKTDGGKLTLSAGGSVTLDGALNGTSGVFSGNINIQKNGSGTVGSGPYYTLYNASTTDGMLFQLNASNNIDFWGLTSNSFTASPVITLTRAGAATFSSSVTASKDGAGNLNTNTTGSQLILSRVAGGGEILGFRNTGSSNGIGGTGYTAQIISDGNNAVELYTVGGQPVIFGTSATERMRITSGGYLKASNDGTYHASSGSVHELRTNVGGNYSAFISNTHPSSPFGLVVYYPNTINNTSSRFLDCEDNTAIRFSVRSNGGLANYQANDVNLSDERVKKDIEPLESYWDKFKAIEIVKFKYKDQTHDDFNIGVIAQQVEAVAPEFVDVDGWDTKPKLDEEGNEIVSEEEPLKSIYTADFHHATIKVLQEAMAKIEKLETEIDSLKNQMQ